VDHSQLPDLELKDAEVDACHIGVITEPECLGPCEPGTSVTLEGIVWNETENGKTTIRNVGSAVSFFKCYCLRFSLIGGDCVTLVKESTLEWDHIAQEPID